MSLYERLSLNAIICQLESRKDESKEKEAGDGPIYRRGSIGPGPNLMI